MIRARTILLAVFALGLGGSCTRSRTPSAPPGITPLAHAVRPSLDAGSPVVDAGPAIVDAGPPVDPLGLKLGVALHEAWAHAKVGDEAIYDLDATMLGIPGMHPGEVQARARLEVVSIEPGRVWVQATFEHCRECQFQPPKVLDGAWLIPVELTPEPLPAPVIQGEREEKLRRVSGFLLNTVSLTRDRRGGDGPVSVLTVALPVGPTYLGGGVIWASHASGRMRPGYPADSWSVNLVGLVTGERANRAPNAALPLLLASSSGKVALSWGTGEVETFARRVREGVSEETSSIWRPVANGTPPPPGARTVGSVHLVLDGPSEPVRTFLPETLIDLLKSTLREDTEGVAAGPGYSLGASKVPALSLTRHEYQVGLIYIGKPDPAHEVARYREVYAADPRSPLLAGAPFEARFGALESVQTKPETPPLSKRWISW